MPLVDDPMDESTPWLIDELKHRFQSTDSGLILDMTHQEPIWCLTVSGFERWFAEVESCLDQTLGRRLAHAAAESEEWHRNQSPALPKSWFGQQKKRISIINSDWKLRGQGQLGVLESENQSSTVIVANRTFTALAAGMGNAAWESIQERRFRFQWADRGVGETIVEMTIDPREIPAPEKSIPSWEDQIGLICDDDRIFHRARHEIDGLWTVEGNRTMMLSRDCILRFENLATSYLSSNVRSTDSRTTWAGVESHEQVVLWDAMAEAARRQFLASGELVLIASPEHWIDVANRHLSFLGLGRVSNASVVDDNGGVELSLPSTLHPAIVTGRLLGCWERAEGRGAKAKWSTSQDGHTIVLESRREIA